MTTAHIAGVPLEEGLLALAPAASVFAAYAAVSLGRAARCAVRNTGRLRSWRSAGVIDSEHRHPADP